MNPSEAREHLDMVERIVAASSRKLEAGGEYFLVWGVASGTMELLLQLASDGRIPASAVWAGPGLFLLAFAFSVFRSRYYRMCPVGRVSSLQREFFNVLWITLSMALATNVIGSHIFTDWAGAAIWNVAAAIVLFYIAMHGNRRALAGGIMLVVSVAFANFNMPIAGYALAAGMYLGYAGFGLADLLARE